MIRREVLDFGARQSLGGRGVVCHVQRMTGETSSDTPSDEEYEEHNVENLSKSWSKVGPAGWSTSFLRIGSLRG